MSVRFSTINSDMIESGYLRALALSLAAWLSLYLIFTWTIDPYGVSPIRLEFPRINALKPKRTDIDRILKPYEVWRYQPRTTFIGTSRAMQKIRRQIESVAQLDVPVLILGEHGTGRETVARLIHELSSRSKYSFEKITCEGFPEELLDSELFGHIENENGKILHVAKGKFEGSANGTVLLEEISRMPLGLQAKILHVVQGGEFFRKGGSSKIAIDVRLMALAVLSSL